MPALFRTPDERFESLTGYQYDSEFIELDEARMAFVDIDDGNPVVCVHGMATWSYLYRETIPILAEEGRVIAPDLIGFGRSDKFADTDEYSLPFYSQSIVRFVEALDLENVTLVFEDWGGIVALAALPEIASRIERLVIMNVPMMVNRTGTLTMTEAFYNTRSFIERDSDVPVGFLVNRGCEVDLEQEVLAGYEAPYPDETYKTAIRAFPQLFPTNSDDEGTELLAASRKLLSTWKKPALVLFSHNDPISKPAGHWFRELIPTAKEQPESWLPGGHFLVEDAGEAVGKHVLNFVNRTS